MSTIIETLYDLGQKLFGLRNELAKARQARKQTVADFLASIAQSIEDAQTAHRNCRGYSDSHSSQVSVAVSPGVLSLQFSCTRAGEASIVGMETLK